VDLPVDWQQFREDLVQADMPAVVTAEFEEFP
jgi:hypothetical protein